MQFVFEAAFDVLWNKCFDQSPSVWGTGGEKAVSSNVLSYGFTIIPFHVRQPIGRQSRVGWFVSREIERFQQRSHQLTMVHLSSGHQVPVLHSRKFCLDQLKNAKWIEMCYGEIHEPHRRQWISGSIVCETAIL